MYFRYYCTSDSAVEGDVNSVKFECPRGFYCPEGTGYDWQPCPKGTYSNAKGLSMVCSSLNKLKPTWFCCNKSFVIYLAVAFFVVVVIIHLQILM